MAYKEIPLNKGFVTIVDEADYDFLNQTKWGIYFSGKAKKPYAAKMKWVRLDGKRRIKYISLHRYLLNPPKDMQVDHINGNALDNRRCNLRICNVFQNRANYPKKKTSKSRYKGVWLRPSGKWQARISFNKKRILLGLFSSEVEAVKAYNIAALKYHGEFASLNEIKND